MWCCIDHCEQNISLDYLSKLKFYNKISVCCVYVGLFIVQLPRQLAPTATFNFKEVTYFTQQSVLNNNLTYKLR